MNMIRKPELRLRVALFSGNYNYTTDGANQALNKLVGYLERIGCQVRVYSPTSSKQAFAPTGTLISVPSIAIPGRSEYRFALGLPRRLMRDLDNFKPDIIHLSAPDLLGRGAQQYARTHLIPCVASVHTRFEAYFDYYGMSWITPLIKHLLRNFYNGCDELYSPTASMTQSLRELGISTRVNIWSRGVDDMRFNSSRRDEAWRQSLGFKADTSVILFVGRLVMEKGLARLVEELEILAKKDLKHSILIVGEGPARPWLQQRLPNAVFTGHLSGIDLARAYASSDIFFNPSQTETFGNVNIEAMASGLPVVGSNATGISSIVTHGIDGLLCDATQAGSFANALAWLLSDRELRVQLASRALKRSKDFCWDEKLSHVPRYYLDTLRRRAEVASLYLNASENSYAYK